jgi:hypothetical protein
MAKSYKKKVSKIWILWTFIMFILIVVLGLTLLREHLIIDKSWTLQENWDSIKTWFNALQFVQDIKGW